IAPGCTTSRSNTVMAPGARQPRRHAWGSSVRLRSAAKSICSTRCGCPQTDVRADGAETARQRARSFYNGSMILSENGFTLFGIMLYDLRMPGILYFD